MSSSRLIRFVCAALLGGLVAAGVTFVFLRRRYNPTPQRRPRIVLAEKSP